jgi:3-methyladenine DNA glycosylase AlkD
MLKDEIVDKLKSLTNQKNIEGMARFGINSGNAFGITLPVLRNIAKEYRGNHELALELWQTGYHEARLLAVFIDDPKKLTNEQIELWVKDFDSWDIVDQTCAYLFDKFPGAYEKGFEWIERDEEFIKRAGFVIIVALSVHDKKMPDEKFEIWLDKIVEHADDERNFVKKAINWLLRQIGKRNFNLNISATKVALELKNSDNKSACWIGSDAYRELVSDAVQHRLKR